MGSAQRAGSTVKTGGQAPDSAQGIWFVPGFGSLRDAQVRLFGPQPLPGPVKQSEWVSINASYYVGIGLELSVVTSAGNMPKGTLEFSAGVFSQSVYYFGPSEKARIISPGVTSQLFTSVQQTLPGGSPMVLSTHYHKKPVVDCGDTVFVSMTGTVGDYEVEFINLTNSGSSKQPLLIPLEPVQMSAYVYWMVGCYMNQGELSQTANFERTFCDQAWCTVGKKNLLASSGNIVSTSFEGQPLVTCSARAKGVLEFNCNLSPTADRKPVFEGGEPIWKAPYHT